MVQAVWSPVDEMQVYQHAGHKGNYTTQMMLKDKDLKIVCVYRGAPLANIIKGLFFILMISEEKLHY